MGQVTTLCDLLANLDELDAEATIYARPPWGPDAAALVEHEPDQGGLPEKASNQGMTYFLEVFIAKELLEDWHSNQTTLPSKEETCNRIIEYAIHDA